MAPVLVPGDVRRLGRVGHANILLPKKGVSKEIFLVSEKYLRIGAVSALVAVDQRRGLGRQLLPARHDHGASSNPGEL